jgi:exonuclease III
MRLVIWNVRSGTQPGILSAVRALEPDVVALVDCRPYNAARIVQRGRLLGFRHSLFKSELDSSGLLLLSTYPLERGDVTSHPMPGLWLHAVCDYWDLELGVAYGPPQNSMHKGTRISGFWSWLLQASNRLFERRAVICGDLKAGDPALDSTSNPGFCGASAYAAIIQLGWRDAFRELHGSAREYSWWAGEHGFRTDHCLLSPQAPSPTRVRYVREVGEFDLTAPSPGTMWKSGLSDHAALLVDL